MAQVVASVQMHPLLGSESVILGPRSRKPEQPLDKRCCVMLGLYWDNGKLLFRVKGLGFRAIL